MLGGHVKSFGLIKGVETFLPRHPIGVERAAEVEEQRFDRRHHRVKPIARHGQKPFRPRAHYERPGAAPQLLRFAAPPSGSSNGIAVDERVAGVTRNAVAELARRALHIIGRRRLQRAADAAVQSQLGAADRVDDDAGAVRRILHRHPEFDFQRRVAEAAPLHANEADLVVLLPRNVVGRPDMDVRQRRAARPTATGRIRSWISSST